jgi:hypothetical protein
MRTSYMTRPNKNKSKRVKRSKEESLNYNVSSRLSKPRLRLRQKQKLTKNRGFKKWLRLLEKKNSKVFR